MSHVHLVEGLLGQQGLHQRPGHGCVVCVAQCFCRNRAGGGDRAAGLEGGGFGLPLTPFIYYFQKASSQPLTPIQVSRALSQSHVLLISGGKPSIPSGCHHCISSLNGPALGLSNLLHIPHPPARPIMCSLKKSRISLSSSHSPARMAVCCLQDEVQTHCLGHLKHALPHPSYIPLLLSTSLEPILESGSSPSQLGLLPPNPLALSPSSGYPSLLLWHF